MLAFAIAFDQHLSLRNQDNQVTLQALREFQSVP